jgi:hypothetical protein
MLEMLTNLKEKVCGMLLDLYKSNPKEDRHEPKTFKMEEPAFAQDLNIRQTVKYGAILYFVVAILVTPSVTCSSSYQSPPFMTPLIAAHRASEILDMIQWTVQISDSEAAMEAQSEKEPSAPVVGNTNAPPFHSHILRASQAYEVDIALIRAIIMAESSNNPRALSHRGAQGLMQLMPATAKSLGVEDAFDPGLNIDGGVRYFKKLLNRFNGNVKLALAAYNAGSRYVRKYDGVPPFKATRLYIKKVLKYRKLYQRQMASNQYSLTL